MAPWADEAKEQTKEVQAIRLVLNEFELISIGIQMGVLDFETYKRWNKSWTIKHWDHAAPFVLALRARVKNDAIYHEFQEMVRWLKENQMPRRQWRRGKWI